MSKTTFHVRPKSVSWQVLNPSTRPLHKLPRAKELLSNLVGAKKTVRAESVEAWAVFYHFNCRIQVQGRAIFRNVDLSRKWPRTAAICYHINASKILDSILDGFLCIAVGILGISGYLFAETFDLLLFAANQFSSLFLHFTGDVI